MQKTLINIINVTPGTGVCFRLLGGDFKVAFHLPVSHGVSLVLSLNFRKLVFLFN